ncbi:hypothetical protein AF71_00044240 [Rhizobium sp. 57MFTsu3.2]|nr:hypothetical protein [Rhizobium sp. 57MFTsu3.2]
MNPTSLPTKEEARLCASVVKEISQTRGVSRDPVAIGKLTVLVARLFNSGLRERDDLTSAAMRSAHSQSDLMQTHTGMRTSSNSKE